MLSALVDERSSLDSDVFNLVERALQASVNTRKASAEPGEVITTKVGTELLRFVIIDSHDEGDP